jgi:hypothetical protein
MKFTEYIEKKLDKLPNKRKILFINGDDKRAQIAAVMHKTSQKIIPILLIENNSVAADIDVEKIVIED